MPAKFFELETTSGLKDKKKLSAFLDGLVGRHRREVKTIGLQYIFCTDEYLLRINRQYLQHDTLTDIITFDLSDDGNTLQGEIYISVERVRENSEKFKVAYANELHRVIFHGALHLCGFKDKNKKDRQAMRDNEDACLAEYYRTTN